MIMHDDNFPSLFSVLPLSNASYMISPNHKSRNPSSSHFVSQFKMDQWKTKPELPQQAHKDPHPEPRERTEVEAKDASVARKVQKADREKLRRDRLNEQFVELGNTLDPDRPKNDKATILVDTIQVLKDLTAEVNRLKAECTELAEESSELTLEKNELREEKASLKSDIENLNVQYQQRVRVMCPWGAIDPSVVMTQPYTYPVTLPVPSAPIPMHPFPFFGNQNPGAIPNPSASFVPYPNPANPHINQPCTTYAPTSCSSSRQEPGSKSSGHLRVNDGEKGDNCSDVVTELELKTPGSRACQESSPGDKKRKQPQRKEKSNIDGSCSSSRYTSSHGFQDNSSNSMGEKGKSKGFQASC